MRPRARSRQRCSRSRRSRSRRLLLERSETRRWRDRLRYASAGRPAVGRRCARGFDRIRRALPQLVTAAGQVGGLGGVANEVDGFVVGRARLLAAAQPAQQVGAVEHYDELTTLVNSLKAAHAEDLARSPSPISVNRSLTGCGMSDAWLRASRSHSFSPVRSDASPGRQISGSPDRTAPARGECSARPTVALMHCLAMSAPITATFLPPAAAVACVIADDDAIGDERDRLVARYRLLWSVAGYDEGRQSIRT
jgi:hypothetical protein